MEAEGVREEGGGDSEKHEQPHGKTVLGVRSTTWKRRRASWSGTSSPRI